ncbi:hypothetical protein KAU33_07265 [Candidatus Dependentiae bacterium]|nr:hypothetical protein [Candidatus Dependentiae bacterium]
MRGQNEIVLDLTLICIYTDLSFCIDKKDKLFLVTEVGLDIGIMKGNEYDTLPETFWDIKFKRGFGFGGHIAFGLDYLLGKDFLIQSRMGYRFLKTPAIYFDDKIEIQQLYIKGTGESGLLKVDWSGLYITFGFNIKIDITKKNQKPASDSTDK